MALFPLCCNFEGDFVLQLLPVDSENSMAEVAAAAAYHTVGRRVKNRPGHVLRVKKPGAKDYLPVSMTVTDAGFKPTETIEVVWESAH